MTALDGSGSWTDPTDPRNRDPALIARVAAWLEPLYSSYFRFRTRGEEHLPRTGNAIFVGLHSGAPLLPEVWLDLVWWVANRGAEDPVYALIHDAALRIPGLRGFLLRLGALRASRRSAERVLETGASLLIYPGGELETQRTFWRRNVVDFHGNSGFARLALRYGVSIVPVAHVGGHEVYFTLATSRRLARWTGMARWLRIQTVPLTVGLPWGVWLGGVIPYLPLPVTIDVNVGQPIHFPAAPELAEKPEAVDRVYRRVSAEMQRLVDELAARRRFPVFG